VKIFRDYRLYAALTGAFLAVGVKKLNVDHDVTLALIQFALAATMGYLTFLAYEEHNDA
jgi:hypothetical protein